MELLTEKFQELLESEKYKKLTASDSAALALMLEQTEIENARLVNEGTLSGDVAQFTPILMPMVRRVYPNLIANELLGVQPMTMPTGFIYALTNQYVGDDDTNKISPLGNAAGLGGQIIVVDVIGTIAVGDTLTAENTATGDVVYIEGNKILVEITAGHPPTAGTV